jgi:serine/threonine protein phosphatase PrpC
MGYKLNIVGKTDVGRRRKNNEDTFLIDPDLGLMIVADGMGGHASGEVASKLATELCGEQVKKALQTGHVPIFYHVPPNPNLDPRSLLLGDCVKYANYAVYEAAQNNPAHKDMGTTLVAALWLDDKMAVAHVGDSRLYVYHDGKLLQRTVDHSFVQEQIAKGKLKAEDAEKSDMKNLLTRSVGNQEDVDVDITEIFNKHLDCACLSASFKDYVRKKGDPFGIGTVRYIRTVEESKSLNELPGQKVILAGSGMCEGGRILHHLRNNIDKDNTVIMLVGYQAGGTLGRRLAEGAKKVKIFGLQHEVRATVRQLQNLSSHADRNDLLWFIQALSPRPRKIFLVHGELDERRSLTEQLKRLGIDRVESPQFGDEFDLA